MRIERYGCDYCGKEFGDAPHLNVKSANVRLSYKGYNNKWQQKGLQEVGGCQVERHFCNVACLASFVGELEAQARISIEPKEGE